MCSNTIPWGLEAEFDDHFEISQDPDQLRDELPQPYRMINKLVGQVFESAWEIISELIENRLKEESRYKPPPFIYTDILQPFVNATCLASSPDEEYLVVGLSNGLAIASYAEEQKIHGVWINENVEIVGVETSQASKEIWCITCVDHLGVVRFFSFYKDRLYLMSSINETPGESLKEKSLARCQTSAHTDYVGLVIAAGAENESQIRETWLEIYHLSKEVWIKELEVAASKSAASISRPNSVTTKAASPKPSSPKPSGPKPSSSKPSSSKPSSPKPLSSNSVESDCDKDKMNLEFELLKAVTDQKFTPPVLVLKLNPPTPVSVSTGSAQSQAGRTDDVRIDDNIGVGHRHLLSSQYVENRLTMFRYLHQRHLQFIRYSNVKEYEDILQSALAHTVLERYPSFHFLHPGKMLPKCSGLCSAGGLPLSLVVWWSHEMQLLHYNLSSTNHQHTAAAAVKSGKGAQENSEPNRIPDLVWPTSCPIVASVTSPCSCLLAVALQSNCILVWNRYSGLPYNVVHVDDVGQISSLAFVNNSVGSQVCPELASNQDRCCLVAQCSSGQLYLVNCVRSHVTVKPVLANEIIEYESECPLSIHLLKGVHELVAVNRQDNRVFVHDLIMKKHLCELVLPECYSFCNSVVTAGRSLHKTLFIIGVEIQTIPAPEGVDSPCASARLDKPEEEIPEEKSPEIKSPEIKSPEIKSPEIVITKAVFFYRLGEDPCLKEYSIVDEEINMPSMPQPKFIQIANSNFETRISCQAVRRTRLQERWKELKTQA